jgi:phage gp29-like protein
MALSGNRIRQFLATRFDPIRGLDTETLARHLDAFESGQLRGAALAWDAIEKRDDIIKTVAPKRKKAVARHGWEVLIASELKPHELLEAQKHKDALEFFYSNLICTNALDANERGAFKLLVRQMMDAVGKRYAVHEIIWKPVPVRRVGGGAQHQLTAEFRFVPLWFFENRTGRLRLLRTELATDGEPLEEGAWMVTVGEGLMVACSIAWMFKKAPLEQWFRYCQRYGIPAVQGITSADRDTPGWQDMTRVVEELMEQLSVVTTADESLKVIDLKGQGIPPFEALVSRMDRLMTALWRGSDLSTLSRSQGYGASLQGAEGDLLETDDAENISETLNTQVDPYVIKYLFGEHARPLAFVRLMVTPRKPSDHDLKIDDFLLRHGARLSMAEALERYGRGEAEAEEQALRSTDLSLTTKAADSVSTPNTQD